jgi:hypothetical protein
MKTKTCTLCEQPLRSITVGGNSRNHATRWVHANGEGVCPLAVSDLVPAHGWAFQCISVTCGEWFATRAEKRQHEATCEHAKYSKVVQETFIWWQDVVKVRMAARKALNALAERDNVQPNPLAVEALTTALNDINGMLDILRFRRGEVSLEPPLEPPN